MTGWGVGALDLLPTSLKPYNLRFACRQACGASDAKSFVHNLSNFFAVFLNNPVNPWTFGTYPDAFPTARAFFCINYYINHIAIFKAVI